MIRIVIFGTGSSGMRALRAAAARCDIEVLGFSDNDVNKHATRIEGLPVISPGRLLGTECEFIVVASQFGVEIRSGLLALGLNQERVVLASLNDLPGSMAALAKRAAHSRPLILDDGRLIKAADLPRVMILTYETLNQSHGTGVILQRHFRDFPVNRLFSICHHENGEPWLQQSLTLSAGVLVPEAAQRVRLALAQHDFMPDLVYATAFDEIDLQVLTAVLDVLPNGVPVVQHFMDYMPQDAVIFDASYRKLSKNITETWALTEGLVAELQRRYCLPVQHVSALHQEPPGSHKHAYGPFGHGFRAVILGNFWQPWMLPMLDRIWQECMRQRPGLRPIDWFSHPLRAQAILDAGYTLGDAIQWKGFVNPLQPQLAAADMAILPLNAEAEAKDCYARFSLPSRITELSGAGLPVAVIASTDTETARFIEARGCALLVSGPGERAIADKLLRLIDDQSLREQLGARARELAVTEFALGPFQEKLLGKLVRLAEGFEAPADWRGLTDSGLVPLAAGAIVSHPAYEELPTWVHYACGRNIIDGWLNIDGFDESYPCGEVPDELAAQILRLDLTLPHPFPNDYFQVGYSEDFIEHISQDEFVIFLCEAYRTFRSGGVLRLSTPALAPILVRHLRGSNWQAGQVFRDEAYTRWWHKHYLCEHEVEIVARAIGWREMRVCEYGHSIVDGLARETRPDQAELNLVVELIK